MFGTTWPKLGILIFLLVWVGICIVGCVQKLRDREVGWKWSAEVYQREGRDPLGYWRSAIANVVFAAVAIWLAIEIPYDRIPVG